MSFVPLGPQDKVVLYISTMIIYLHKANAPSIPVAPYKTAQRCSHTYANEQLSTSSIDPMVQYFVIPSLHRLWKVSSNQRRLYTSSGGHQRNLLEKKQIRRLLWKNNRKRHKTFIFKLFVSFPGLAIGSWNRKERKMYH